MTLSRQSAGLSGVEYQRWYDYGILPERLHDRRASELKAEFIAGDISVDQLEADLESAFGITPALDDPGGQEGGRHGAR